MTSCLAENKSQSLLIEIENELAKLSGAELHDSDYHPVRRLVSRYLLCLCKSEEQSSSSLPDAIDQVISCGDNASRRTAALLVTRISGIPNILPEQDSTSRLKRNVVQLFEQALPDLARKFNIDSAAQTYQKFEVISGSYALICEQLAVLARLPSDTRVLLASQQEVMRTVSNDKVSAYLTPYDLKRVKASLSHIFAALREITEVSDSTFGAKIADLGEFVARELKWTIEFPTFLNKQYYAKFLHTISECLHHIESDARDRFVCELKPKRQGKDVAEKHYPLHDVGRLIRASIILTNTGPGVALDVLAEISTDSESVQFDSTVRIGDIAPGDYPLSFEIMPSSASDRANFLIMLTWLEVGHSERKSHVFDLVLVGQNPSVDWGKLATRQPYSTEVAEGEEFVGRTSKVDSLSSRFQMDRMGSSFITGQKRVGKTSLARAVERKIKETNPKYEILYLEYGQYSRMDPVDTVEALGQELADFLIGFLPASVLPSKDLNFRGSIAPLNKIADILAKELPDKRFIFILDEFDEIHPEMYRFGALAETFFANLRTLSAKKNIAFLLVGGEKMPFVMSAQGDQLNKFVSEALDYFVRGDEWDDYKELVIRPVRDQIAWSDTAVQRVFDLTNGHPYYTKLLCARVLANAVRERDSEITESDIKYCTNKLVAELDSNAFAHLWKDGISEERIRAEVIELNRRRVLSASARALRAKLQVSFENIILSKAALRISDSEVTPILNDFVRRRILIENRDNKRYTYAIPLFERWLEETGISRLMSDALAEEYESAEQRAEESARVTSAEIVEVTDEWQVYRGSKIGADDVRAWLEQVNSNRDQRLLFKLLQNLRFFSKVEIREALSQAHNMLREHLPSFVQGKRSDRRKDILVTWVDGPGKSGNTYAGLYVEENKIFGKCLVSPESFSKALINHENSLGSSVAAVVIVDDFIGTGDSLGKNIKSFVEENRSYLEERNIRLLAVAVAATHKGAQRVRDEISRLNIDADLHVHEPIVQKHFAFGDDLGFWDSVEEKGRGKELCQRLGARIHRSNHLGYGDQGLLLVFPETCPNNSLPILHGDVSGSEPWRALFPRPKN